MGFWFQSLPIVRTHERVVGKEKAIDPLCLVPVPCFYDFSQTCISGFIWVLIISINSKFSFFFPSDQNNGNLKGLIIFVLCNSLFDIYVEL